MAAVDELLRSVRRVMVIIALMEEYTVIYNSSDTGVGWSISSEIGEDGNPTNRLIVTVNDLGVMQSFIALTAKLNYTIDIIDSHNVCVHLIQ